MKKLLEEAIENKDSLEAIHSYKLKKLLEKVIKEIEDLKKNQKTIYINSGDKCE